MTDAATPPPTTGATGSPRPVEDPSAPFFRANSRHRFTAREAVVTAVARPVDQFVRVTLSGPDFDDFVSTGPTDHVRVFFPHPITGELVAPRAVGPGEEGIVRPEAPMFARDFTPLAVRFDEATGQRTLALDILRHVDPGPAAAWGEQAKVGDRLVIVGPRGSKNAPQNAARVVLVVDPTALPSATRWLAELPSTTVVEVIADVPGDIEWVETYLREESGRDDVDVMQASGSLADSLEMVGTDAETFVFGAGEASRLIPLRRHLRYELALPREQYALSGYWRRGVVGFDHHEPIDPSDPD
ncbi:siderophore-interacting protein [Microbacterium sp. 4R-513]|uniref:siderophore-interacting protein n=1 Tax=Microbacterium sp. 4R-513 TaxID=2567934 RepID=UPI0013E1E766|nr:siderophore-interacting protein [Microbacterium sp. 4R-513]QIG38880.1 siderophore-interacting protein [Microbacterium sp. 4R-513]